MPANYNSEIRLTTAVRHTGSYAVATQKFPTPPVPVPVADFTYTPSSGDVPLEVTFTNTSTGNPMSFEWDFNGNGSVDSRSSTTVSHTYTTAGTHSARLKVANQGGNHTKTVSIVVNSHLGVVASFTYSAVTGVVPKAVTFTDTSSNTPTSWLWDFGDGTTSTLKNPVHTYAIPGTHTVSLTASNGTSSDTVTEVDLVTLVNQPPIPNFTALPVSGNVPLNVVFTDASTDPTVGGPATRAWDFTSDGVVDSTAVSPSYTYNVAGTYSVSLRLTNDGGTNIITKPSFITVLPAAAAAEFTAAPLAGPIPMLVSFYDLTLFSVTAWFWSFGDGTTSTLQNPTHTYTTAGPFTVSLTTTNSGGSLTKKKVSYVVTTEVAPVASFTASPTTGPLPLTVVLTNTSTGIGNSYQWDFTNNGSTDSIAVSPSYTFTSVGSYSVKLIATNSGGVNTFTQTDLINVTNVAPVSNFTATPVSGSYPLTVTFTDTSTGVATSWLWDFGDGWTSTLRNPSHSYTTHGSFTVSLSTTNDGGTHTKSSTNFVTTVNPIPVANFTATPVTGNIPVTTTFTNTTTGVVASWLWNFGDGATSTLQHPTHTYSTVGSYTVTLTATNDGGSNTKTATALVNTSLPLPVANFTATPLTGTNPLTVTFTDASTGTIVSRAWTFGDSGTSTAVSPSHAYAAAGTYTVTLTVTNSSGSNTKTSTNLITVTEPVYNSLDPLNKSSNIVLSNGNLTATAATDGIVRGLYPVTINGSGTSPYYEIHIDSFGGGIWFGWALATVPMTTGTFPGQSVGGGCYASSDLVYVDGASYNMGMGGAWLAQGLTYCGIQLSQNGYINLTSLSTANGNSGMGVGHGYTIVPGVYYPVVRLTSGARVTFNFGATAMHVRTLGTWTSGM